jgi:predicted transcriptional regulator of viral defense system
LWVLRQREPFETIDVEGRYGSRARLALARLVRAGILRRLAPGRYEVAR